MHLTRRTADPTFKHDTLLSVAEVLLPSVVLVRKPESRACRIIHWKDLIHTTFKHVRILAIKVCGTMPTHPYVEARQPKELCVRLGNMRCLHHLFKLTHDKQLSVGVRVVCLTPTYSYTPRSKRFSCFCCPCVGLTKRWEEILQTKAHLSLGDAITTNPNKCCNAQHDNSACNGCKNTLIKHKWFVDPCVQETLVGRGVYLIVCLVLWPFQAYRDVIAAGSLTLHVKVTVCWETKNNSEVQENDRDQGHLRRQIHSRDVDKIHHGKHCSVD
mmetsp:Transcript_32248/g.53296  ORF Transcript_32248/g.53296 Transcript_32248/m.53296 type:complete len:271 (-) Transcript_32248:2505-3317(-)